MLSEPEQRAARLAIAWYGVDPAEVLRIARAVQAAKAHGAAGDLLAALARERVLSADQVDHLRHSLAQTRVEFDDPATPAPGPAPAGRRAGQDPPQLGPYRILRRLGEGGMGAVYLGYDKQAHRHVAIKVLAPEHAVVPTFLDRFQREGRNGALLDHPNLVRTYETGRDPASGLHYLVLEYVAGPTAHDLLDRLGRLPVGDAVRIALDVARALASAHGRAIIHRDIKPANILLTPAGLAKLSDMGLAKKTDEASDLTRARQGVGTPYYVPYEQAVNARYADTRSDLYALGATLYHLVTGDVPFPGDSALEVVERKQAGRYPPARAVNPAVPAALDQVIARLLARDPADRYPSAAALIADLEASQLAAAVPSFADPDLALQDPVVRQRLSAPMQPTCPDIQAGIDSTVNPAEAFWYLKYRDGQGNPCKAKVTPADVARRLQDGRLPAGAAIGRTPQGPFTPVADVPELRELLAEQAPASPRAALARARARWRLLAGATGLILAAAAAAALLLGG